jgi:8-oxo-dGTP pyrophosphatase MutT (NUDIX family)
MTRVFRQVAVIAFRRVDRDVEVCLIRRRDGGSWSLPKGFVDPGHTPEQAALTEAHEEAGISGRVVGALIGTYVYQKGRAVLSVAVYVMEVASEQATWPEMRFRERRWASMADARTLLAEHPARSLLDEAAAQLDGDSG